MIFFELFYNFFLIGLFTFGGGYAMIPLIQDMIVGKWGIEITHISDFIAISEATPGPFALNIATFVGNQAAGPFGAFCATIGVILPSFIIILLIAWLLNRFTKNRFVKAGLTGVGPIVLALITSTIIVFFVRAVFFNNGQIHSDFVFDLRSLVLFIVLGSFVIIYKRVKKKSLNPLLMLALSALLGLIIFI